MLLLSLTSCYSKSCIFFIVIIYRAKLNNSTIHKYNIWISDYCQIFWFYICDLWCLIFASQLCCWDDEHNYRRDVALIMITLFLIFPGRILEMMGPCTSLRLPQLIWEITPAMLMDMISSIKLIFSKWLVRKNVLIIES